ncbi:MAG: hypothetical protein RL217_1083 [Pseudomonadota bacterium]|jgi:predicted Zn finger-like uncharacterized protein
MAVQVTRCPHCQTSFRINDEQLAAARGMVRCGSCLQVFKAADYFLNASAQAKPQAPAAKPQAPNAQRPAPAAPATKPQAPNAQRPAPAAPATKPQAPNAQRPAPAAQPQAPSPKPQTPNAQRPAPAAKRPADEDDFGLIHDDMDSKLDGLLKAPKPAYKESRIDLDLDESIFSLENIDPDSFDAKTIQHEDDQDSNLDESWASALLDDEPQTPAAKPKTPAAQRPTPSAPAAKPQSVFTDDFNFDRPAPEKDDFQGFLDEELELDVPTGFNLGGDLYDQPQSVTQGLKSSHFQLEPEPLKLHDDRTAQRSARAWGWPLACLALILIALLQVLVFRFDHLSRTPSWRPFYGQVCKLTGCTLPKVQNIQTIGSQNLVVRAHPSLKGALMIDTLLLNKADYEQPFPDVQLVFKDLNDRVVASRRFSPSQYLQGELAGQSDMPAQVPVHIAFEILDPGAEAVSYAITLLANQ